MKFSNFIHIQYTLNVFALNNRILANVILLKSTVLSSIIIVFTINTLSSVMVPMASVLVILSHVFMQGGTPLNETIST